MTVGPLVVRVARLRRSPGTTLRLSQPAPADHEALAPATPADSRVPDGAEVTCNLLLESYSGGIMVTGTVGVPWVGVCRRCTAVVDDRLDIFVKERFCDPPARDEPADEDAFLIVDDAIDLGPMVHEAILSELPLAPLCREDCQGLCPHCGIDRNEEHCECVAPRDPRWASLDVLRSTS